MGKIFWGLTGFAVMFFTRAYFESKGTFTESNRRSDGNLLHNCAQDSVDFETSYGESLALCRSVMSDLSMSYNPEAETRGLIIIGGIFMGLAVWRAFSVFKDKNG